MIITWRVVLLIWRPPLWFGFITIQNPGHLNKIFIILYLSMLTSQGCLAGTPVHWGRSASWSPGKILWWTYIMIFCQLWASICVYISKCFLDDLNVSLWGAVSVNFVSSQILAIFHEIMDEFWTVFFASTKPPKVSLLGGWTLPRLCSVIIARLGPSGCFLTPLECHTWVLAVHFLSMCFHVLLCGFMCFHVCR